MNKFAWTVTIAAILLAPLISCLYVFLRLAGRAAQLRYLFTLPGIVKAYLTSKGFDVSKKSSEDDATHLKRLRDEFHLIFKTELKSEYGRSRYLWAILLGSVSTALVAYYLATSSFGRFLSGDPNIFPSPLQVALLGAFAWNLWLMLSSYDTLDLVPSTFYWMPFRYVVAIIAGLLASHLFKENGIAIIFALTATVIPYPRLLGFLQDRVPGFKQPHSGDPPIWKIQGMHESTVNRLGGLGIYTTQELAYVDPLMVLFRTNFQPKVVIDWIDQAMLYNYVGEKINELRVRGIRGSIELSGAEADEVLEGVAKVLNTDKDAVIYLRDKLRNDYQVKLVSKLWDEFKPS